MRTRDLVLGRGVRLRRLGVFVSWWWCGVRENRVGMDFEIEIEIENWMDAGSGGTVRETEERYYSE